MSSKSNKQTGFLPEAGFILAKPVSVEELSKTDTTTLLSLPDSASKEKDSVGIARIVALGGMDVDTAIKHAKYPDLPAFDIYELAKPGDLIAYIPYTDAIVMVGIEKHNLVPYRNVMGRWPEATQTA